MDRKVPLGAPKQWTVEELARLRALTQQDVTDAARLWRTHALALKPLLDRLARDV